MAAVVDRARSCVVVRDREWSCAAVVRGCARLCAVVRGRVRRSCVVVRGRAWSCAAVVRGRAWSCVVMRGCRAWSCVVVRVRAWSCVVVRGRAWSCVVVRGRAWSCVVVRGRAWSCVVVCGGRAAAVRGRARRSCVVVRGPSCVVVRGHAWSCAVVRSRARSCVVVRGSAWSCVVVTHCRSARFAASTSRPALPWRTEGRTHTGRTTYNTPLNPPGVGWVNFFYPINVIVSIRTCVPNLGSIRGSVRKNCLLSLIIDVIVNTADRGNSSVIKRFFWKVDTQIAQ